MSGFINELKKITKDLNSLDIDWALVGAIACSAHTEPRTTSDIDIIITLKEDSKAQQLALIEMFLKRGYTDKEVLMHGNPTYRMGYRLHLPNTIGYKVPVDFLFNTCGIETEIIKSSKELELIPGLSLRIASLGHILAMKILSQNKTDRVRDRTDIYNLLKSGTAEDIALSRVALSLITKKGLNRGKDLLSDLDWFISHLEKG